MVFDSNNVLIPTRLRKPATVFIALLLSLTASLAYADVAIFLNIDSGKVAGESKSANHEGEIEVLAWSWGIANSSSMQTGASRARSKADFQDMAITKFIDKSSATLLKNAASGRLFEEATLTVQKTGEAALDYIVITMKKVSVSSVSQAGSMGEDRLTESVTLNFAEVDFKYVEQKNTGDAGDAHEFGWDIPGNKPK